jgi:uncharacterized membrane protein YfcA/S1-C subfamily serine protease
MWGVYIVNTYEDDDYSASDDSSVSAFLFRNAAMPDTQRLYYTVPPAVVGVVGGGVNAGPVAAGAIVGANGYVVTTLHSVSNFTDIEVQVSTPTGIRRYPAQVVKSVPSHDLVLLKMLTRERFLFFKMADSASIASGQPVFAFGRNVQGSAVVRQGTVLSSNAPLDIGGNQITHLLRSDAVYTWEQNGGPLVNVQGELLGINITATGPGGRVEGFTVPSQVFIAHFRDVLRFNTGIPAAAAAAAAGPTKMVPAAGAASWWAKARAQAGTPATSGLGMNVVQSGPVGAAGPGATAPRPGIVDVDHAGGWRIAGYSLTDTLGLIVLALAAGITGGMMTMGGGVLQVAGMMVFFGYGMYLIRPVAFLTNVAVYGAAAWRNNNAGLVQWDKVTPLIPWGVAGVILGYFFGNAIGDTTVGVLLGLFALLMAAKAIHEIAYADPDCGVKSVAPGERSEIDDALGEDEPSAKAGGVPPLLGLQLPEGRMRSAVLGLPMGLISGILGISGGVVEVPLQRYIGKVALHNAIANSSVLVFWASVAGTVVAFTHGLASGLIHWEAPVFLAIVMIPGAYFGGLLGTRLMHVLPVPVLKGVYAATMAAIAIKMLFAS